MSKPDEDLILHELNELRRQNAELKTTVEKMVEEQKQPVENLRQCEQKYSLLFKKSAIPTSLSKLPEGIIVDVNEAFEHEFKITKQDALGKTTLELGISPDTENTKRILEALKESGSVRNQEMALYSKSGEKQYYKSNIDKVNINGEEYLINTIQNISEYKKTLDITLKKQAEKKLKNSEARYKAVFESTGTATLIVDEDKTILMANTECLNATGYAPSELIGRKWTDYVAPESLEEMIKNHELRRNSPEPASLKYEVKLVNKKKEKRDVILNVSMIQGTNQSVVSMLDITERKQAEAALEEYFENDISADYIAMVSGEIISCNKTFLDLFGFENKSETDKLDITNLFKEPADRKLIIQLLTRNGKVENYEVEFVSTEGKPIHALVNAIGIFDMQNKLEKIRGYIVEISEQKRVEKELLKLSRAIEQSPVSVIITDLDGNIQYVNPKTLSITGYSKEELIGKNPRILNSGEKQKSKYKQLWETISSGKEWFGEFHSKKKNGELYWESATISPIFNEKQEIINYVAVKEDITELKKFINDLKASKEIAEESEEKYKQLIGNIRVGIVVHTPDTSIILSNPEAERILGLSRTQLEGKKTIDPDWYFVDETGNRLIPDEYPVAKVISSQQNIRNKTFGINRPQTNDRIWVEVNAYPEYHTNNKLKQVVVTFIDITERKFAEHELISAKEKAEENERLQITQKQEIELNNERLESLLRISQFQTTSIQELLDYALAEAIKLTKSKIGYIYFYNETTRQFILNTWSKEVMDECKVINPQTVYDLDRTGCWGEAVRQRKPIVLNNYAETNPIKKGTPDGHVQLSKFLTIPVIFDEKIVAVTGVANKAQDYNSADIRQLTLLMDVVWKMSERISLIGNLENAKKQAEENEKKFSTAFHSTPNVSMITNIDTGEILEANDAVELVAGFSRDETIGNSVHKMNLWMVEGTREKFIEKLLRDKRVLDFESTFRKKSGETFIGLISGQMIQIQNQNCLLSIIHDITDRKNAETELLKAIENLEESESKFKNLYESLSLAYLILKDGVCIECNEATLKIYGVDSKDDIIGKSPTDFSPEFQFNNLKSSEVAAKYIQNTIEKGFQTFEWVAMRNNKETFYAEVSLKKLYYNNELYIQCLTTDITERKQIENELIKAKEKAEENERSLLLKNEEYECINEELRHANEELLAAKEKVEESESKFKNLYESLSLAYLIIKDGVCIDCNKAALEIYGIENKDEIIGKPPTDFSPEFQPNKKSSLDEAIKQTEIALKKGYHTFEWVAMRKNKELFYNEVSLKKFYYKNELYLQCLTTDITERKRIENELIAAKEKAEENERKLSEANEIAKLGSWELDIKSGIFTLTDNFYKIFHTSAEEMGGYQMTVKDYTKQFVHPEDASMIDDEIIKAIETDDPNFSNYIEHRILYKNSSHGYIGVRFFIVKDEHGETIKAYGVNQDITERKITELELIHAKEKAEESDRLKSAFLANMSHEIRTPMNGILGFTQLLLEPDLSSEEKDGFINIVHQSGQRMLNTVNDIVEISKIEAGLIMIKKEVTDVNNRVAELVHFFTPEAEEKGLQLILKESLPETTKKLITDENKLNSILTNLIKNAIKYTRLGTITVGCRLIGSELECYVKDTGMGIPKDRQQAIFDRFIQADIADTRAFEGSGLGLAICKSYVEMLGGKIWVESEEGKGSTFYFTIPVTRDTEENPSNDVNISIDNKNAKSKTKELKILIAEDDEASRKYISLIIKNFCKEVFEANTGVKTVELCRNNKDIDLILMDIQMPDLDGYEATRQIREFNQNVIIIAQTAFALSGDKEKAISAGCNDYITKPINKTKLENLLLKYFE